MPKETIYILHLANDSIKDIRLYYEGKNYTLEVKQRQKTPIELSLFMMRSFSFVKCSNNTYMHWSNPRSLSGDPPVISAKWTSTISCHRSGKEWSVESLLWFSLLCSEKNQWKQSSLSNFDTSSGNLAAGNCSSLEIQFIISHLPPQALSSLFRNFHWKSAGFHEPQSGRIPLDQAPLPAFRCWLNYYKS